MSITYANLKTRVAAMLQDPDAKTFDAAMVARFVDAGVAEVGRFAPRQFQEDIDPSVSNPLVYLLLSDDFAAVAQPGIEVSRVELWDETADPHAKAMTINPAAMSSSMADSQAGWSCWGGYLYIPNRIAAVFDGVETDYSIRVWGYAPYVPMAVDADTFSGGPELEYAVVSYAILLGLEQLQMSRDTFTQWQTRSGNSDVSPAGLMSALSQARQDWRMRKRELTHLRARV